MVMKWQPRATYSTQQTSANEENYLSAGIETGNEELQNVRFYASHGLVHRESRGNRPLLGTGLDDLLTIEAVHI